ncbi:MAG: hypothetical protein Q9160_006173 [Pyrenula sp. 1 TL-2023]
MLSVQATTFSPDPTHVTLHLRHARTSTLLSLPNTTPITPTLKHALLTGLHARSLTHLPGSNTPIPPLPTDPSNSSAQEIYDMIELAILVDRRDPAKGWLGLEVGDIEAKDSDIGTGKGKGKGKEKVSLGGPGSVLNETILGAGLKDGDSVAFRIREGEAEAEDEGWEGVVQLPSLEEEEGE